MQETTAGPAHGGTGSVTIADIVGLAAERYGERTAARFKRDDEWREVSYRELAETVSEIARGLVDLGLQPGRAGRPAVHDPRRMDVRGLRDHVGRRASWSRSIPPTRPTSARGSSATPSRASSSARTPRRWRRSSPCATSCRSSSRSSRSSRPRARSAVDDAARAAAAGATRARSPSGSRRSSPRTPTRSSTRPGRPGRRRAACSRTATTGRSPACARRSTSSRPARSSTSTCRSRTPTRC